MEKNRLIDLFSEDNQKEESRISGKILIFDAHNLAYRTLFSAIFTNQEDNNKFYFWRYLFLNSLFTTIQEFNPNKVILAYDSKPSWRYKVYSDYKANRKEARERTIIDFDKFFPIFDVFREQIKNTFTKIYTLNVENSEADDIIAILCRDVFKDDDCVIISSDSDINQLITSRIRQYDPIKKKFVECINPKKNLDIKILTGDKSDNIPPVKKKIGIVTAEKILNNGLDVFLKESDEIKSNYIRNKTLIDLDFIPLEIKKNIINTYNNYQLHEMESNKVLNFFIENKLIKILQQWDHFSSIIKGLS